ncbi:MAG TPA: hypothetical protein VNW06_06735, partial [Cytophagaceae bacterium]|nr:hypothetical protein [Cytophagaceae bacterium]
MRRWIFFILLFLNLEAFSQVLKTTLPFSIATPFIDPDGRKVSLKLNENEFVILSKVKGALHGESAYQLEKYDKELTQKFKIQLVCPNEEEFRKMLFNGKDILLFSVLHDEAQKKSTLIAYTFDVLTGEKKSKKILHEHSVGDWMEAQGKGAVKTTFDNEICSSLAKNFTSPFDYQYQIHFSPDKSKILTYIFDYSQKNLQVDMKIYDNDLNELKKAVIPIDNGFINYTIALNNKGDIYILNSERTGRIVVIQYNLTTKVTKLLDIQNASTNRSSLNLQVFSDNEVYLSCINTAGNKLAGVMYAKFDFKQNTIERLNFHDLSEGIKQTVQVMRSSNKNLTGEENWMNYEIVKFEVNQYEKIIM